MSKSATAVIPAVETVDINEAATWLGVTAWTVRWWIKTGRYPGLAFRVGGRWRVRREALARIATGASA